MKRTVLALIFVILVSIVQVACAQYDVLFSNSSFMTVSSSTGTPIPNPTASESPNPTLTPTPDIPTPTPTPSFIPQPSVPEFTLRLIPSFPEENKTTIELVIENQPFDKDNIYHYSFVYNVRIRTSDENWTDLYTAEDGYPYQSDTEQTVLSYVSGEIAYYPPADYPAAPSKKVGILPSYGQVDFQVEAMIGYRTRTWKYIVGEQMLPYVFEGERSGWSNTQTITIPDLSLPLSSPTPSAEPQSFPTTLVIGAIVALIIIGIGLIVYFKKLGNRATISID